jgi:hypothetical protein
LQHLFRGAEQAAKRAKRAKKPKHVWDDHDAVAEFVFEGQTLFDSKYRVRGQEYSTEYIEETVEQFGKWNYNDELDPEHLDVIWPPLGKLTELLPPADTTIYIGGMTIVPDLGEQVPRKTRNRVGPRINSEEKK